MRTSKSRGSAARDLEAFLDQAASRVAGGEEPEAVLADHPAHAARLGPLLEVVGQVRLLQEAPPSPNLAAGRARFLAQASAAKAARSKRRSPASPGIVAWPSMRWGTALLRPMVTLTIVAVIFSLVGFTAQAAGQSLPGSPLFPVKLAVERTQVALTLDPEDAARLHTDLAQKRLDEIELLARAGHGPTTPTLELVENQWLTSLQAIAALSESATPVLLEHAMAILMQEADTLEAILVEADPPVRDGLEATLQVTQQVEDSVRQALANPSEFRRHYSRPTPAAPATQSHSMKPSVPLPTPTGAPEPPAAEPTEGG
ncbi:MAG: hypothetical protein GX605_04745, partial [Chloroflexi bacterium]|nr:hypothetical protein [Chloroflexota bacterium]